MKFLKQILIILIVFFKTGNLLSDNNLFSVNNILLEKKDNMSNEELTNKAIKKAFNQLIDKILIKDDLPKVANLKFSNIRELVTYYNISQNLEQKSNKINFNVTFDKGKIHELFYKKRILYSDITDKEFFILPIFLKENEIFIFSNNYFYTNWNKIKTDELVEFILPMENIEIIQTINKYRNNLFDLKLDLLFGEYSDKNIAIIFIEESLNYEENIYLKTRIQNKIVSKNFKLKKNDHEKIKFYQKIILEVKDEIINLVKSQNLIDISTPSFLNVRLNFEKNSNLVQLNSKISNIDLIENIFVQEFNKDYVNLKIKYLGGLERIINQLKKKDISLQLINDQWFIKTM